MLIRTAILSTSLLFSCLPMNAWAGAGSERSQARREIQEKKRAQKEHEVLARSAELYWKSVRWSDTNTAAKFVENPGLRMVFQQSLEDQIRQRRIVDSRILRIQVGSERGPKETSTPVLREAIVTVQLEAYTLPAQVLSRETIRQQWFRTAQGWWLKYQAPDTLTPDEAPAPEVPDPASDTPAPSDEPSP